MPLRFPPGVHRKLLQKQDPDTKTPRDLHVCVSARLISDPDRPLGDFFVKKCPDSGANCPFACPSVFPSLRHAPRKNRTRQVHVLHGFVLAGPQKKERIRGMLRIPELGKAPKRRREIRNIADQWLTFVCRWQTACSFDWGEDIAFCCVEVYSRRLAKVRECPRDGEEKM